MKSRVCGRMMYVCSGMGRYVGVVKHTCKRDKAESGRRRPQLHFIVSTSGRNHRPSGRVRQRMHLRRKVTLLFEDVRLASPLPNKQLAQSRAAKREPFSRGRDGTRVDPCLRNRECMHLDKTTIISSRSKKRVAGSIRQCACEALRVGRPSTRQLIQSKDTSHESDDQHVRATM